jgi:hypothetical protein
LKWTLAADATPPRATERPSTATSAVMSERIRRIGTFSSMRMAPLCLPPGRFGGGRAILAQRRPGRWRTSPVLRCAASNRVRAPLDVKFDEHVGSSE